jgi:ADP-ribosylglycohydrolase
VDKLEQFQGCILGGAVGDALGAPVEFMKLGHIWQKYGNEGIKDFDYAYGKIGAITDDTQMTMFTIEALCQFFTFRRIPLEALLTQAYLYWLETQDSSYNPDKYNMQILKNKEIWARRAPGNTCLGALKMIRDTGVPFNNSSKGCGGVMRSAPIGLAVDDPDEAYCAGKMSALITHHGVDGFIPAGALARIISLMVNQGYKFRDAQIDTFNFLTKEEAECGTINLWNRVLNFDVQDNKFDIEHLSDLGEGWTGDEALAISLYCSLKNENDVLAAIQSAVNHSGDSDSTGSITGQILGASKGIKELPILMLEQLELSGVLMEQAAVLYGLTNE